MAAPALHALFCLLYCRMFCCLPCVVHFLSVHLVCSNHLTQSHASSTAVVCVVQGEAVFDFVNVTSTEMIIGSLDGMPMEGCTLRVQKLADAMAGTRCMRSFTSTQGT